MNADIGVAGGGQRGHGSSLKFKPNYNISLKNKSLKLFAPLVYLIIVDFEQLCWWGKGDRAWKFFCKSQASDVQTKRYGNWKK